MLREPLHARPAPPVPAAAPAAPVLAGAAAAPPAGIDPAEVDAVLRERFGLEAFRPGQREVIECLLRGEHALAVRPTGSGKSLCYQLPALLLRGTTVVVSPLIALITDQVERLRRLGVEAVALHSGLAYHEHLQAVQSVRSGRAQLVFISPERFRSDRFLADLAGLRIGLFAVDEAHCVSHWGHDFRPDYRRLAEARHALGDPVTVALTATATERVQEDIVSQLGLDAAHTFVSGFERQNLFFRVIPIQRRAEKLAHARGLLEALADGAALIYCQTRREAEALCGDLGGPDAGVGLYHAGLPDYARADIQDAFMSGRMPVLCATNAFGMGIDRPDIRLVLHHGIPRSLEAYYQECGRAGRDGARADCVLLYNYVDRQVHDFFIDAGTPGPEVVDAVWRQLRPEEGPGPRALEAERWGQALREALERARPPRAPLGARRAPRRPRPGPLMVRGALRLLQDAGRVRLDRQQQMVEVLPDPPRAGDDLGVEWTAALAFKEGERSRVQRMIRYAADGACRSATILRYFGDPAARRGACGHCDVCNPEAFADGPTGRPGAGQGSGSRAGPGGVDPLGLGPPPLPPRDDARTVARKVLSCVARMGGHATRSEVACCLAGSRSQRTTERGHDRLSTFGILRELRQEDIRRWIDALAEAELLFRRAGRVSLTAAGREVMAGRSPLPEGLG